MHVQVETLCKGRMAGPRTEAGEGVPGSRKRRRGPQEAAAGGSSSPSCLVGLRSWPPRPQLQALAQPHTCLPCSAPPRSVWLNSERGSWVPYVSPNPGSHRVAAPGAPWLVGHLLWILFHVSDTYSCL